MFSSRLILWQRRMHFWQPYQKIFSKKPQICHSDSKRREKLWIFWTEDYFSSNCASAHVEYICDHPVKNLSSKLWKGFARIPERMKNLCAFQKKNFSPKCSSEHAQWNFGKPSVTLLPKKRKTFPNSKNVEVTNFWTNLFFSSKMIL